LCIPLALLGFGCQVGLVDDSADFIKQAEPIYTATTDDILWLTDDALVIDRLIDGTLVEQRRFGAADPMVAVWGDERDKLFWVEPRQPNSILPESDTATGYVIRSLDLLTGETTDLYRTREHISDLRPSSQSHLLAFQEGEDLFVVSTTTGQIERVVERVKSYEWAPQVLEMIVQTEDDWMFVDINSAGGVTELKQLVPHERILGATYVDRRQLLAAIVGEEDGLRGVQLVTLSLTNDSVTPLEFLRSLDELSKADLTESTKDDDLRPPGLPTDPSYRLWLSPTSQLVLMDQFNVLNNEHQQFLYHREHRRRRPIKLSGELLAWRRDDDMILALPAETANDWTLESFSVTSGERVVIGSRRQPISPLSIYSL